MSPSETSERYWVISFLVTGDAEDVDAVTAEGLIKTTVWARPSGAQHVASSLARFADRSERDQNEWRRLLQREEGSWG